MAINNYTVYLLLVDVDQPGGLWKMYSGPHVEEWMARGLATHLRAGCTGYQIRKDGVVIEEWRPENARA